MKNKTLPLLIFFLFTTLSFPSPLLAASLTVQNPLADHTFDSGTLALTFVGPIENDQVSLTNGKSYRLNEIEANLHTLTQEIAKEFDTPDYQATLDNNGQWFFPNLPNGLFLLTAPKEPTDIRLNLPLLVQINENQTIHLKFEKIEEPSVSTVTHAPLPNQDSNTIPFTGQSWWTVIVCTLLSFIFLGISLRGGSNHD